MVGNWRRVKFWKDRWCSKEPLCEIFPSLFAFSDSKGAWVADLWEHRGEGGNWNFRFVRNVHDWELGAMERFLSVLQGYSVKREQEDGVVWKGGNKGVFSDKGLYSVLETGSTTPLPLKIVGNPWIPSKASFFTWEACWGKVLTLDQLQERGWTLANGCALCKVELETIDHIFLHCDKARLLWQLVFSIFGVWWVIFETIGERCIKAWTAAPTCVFWTLWKERNKSFLIVRNCLIKG